MEESAVQGGIQALTERALETVPLFGPRLTAWWQEMSIEGGMDPALAILVTLGVLAVAYGIEFGVVRLIALVKERQAKGKEPKIESHIAWVVGRAASLLLFLLLCDLGIALLSTDGSTLDWISSIVIDVALRFRVFLSLIELLGRQVDNSPRVDQGSTSLSSEILRRAIPPLLVASVFFVTRTIVLQGIGPGDAVLAVGLILTMALTLATIWVFFSIRKPGAELIRRIFTHGEDPGFVVSFAMKYWYAFYAAFLILSDLMTFSSEIGLAGEQEDKPAIGILLLLLPSLLIANRSWLDRKLESIEGRAAGWFVGISSLVEGILLVAAASFVLDAWGVWSPQTSDNTELEQTVGRALFAIIVLVVGLSIWRAISAVLELHAPPEDGATVDPHGETGQVVASRYATVYPVIRAFALVAVYSVTIMIALSSMGVEIGPLIAGAGVVGLAIGFGAQTIVKDIISGIFYLQEDAFRIGEYIVTDEGKGTVEKISLRSVRLRHHRGAVYTIPFGDMGTIQNHSRDWVKIKFTIEVPAEEDLERLRKLIKMVGAGLLEDPEIGNSFLEPLKSQGAVAMNGPNYIVGIKFTCRPGEQFIIRRKAYVALQKAAAEHGISGVTPKILVEATGQVDPVVGAAGTV